MFLGNSSHQLPQLKDPNEGRPLENILPFYDRILSLIVRNQHKIRDLHDYAQIWGSLNILQGLEYHYNNFLKHLRALAAKDHLGDDRMLDHEAVAYLHRLGQFYYFAQSLKLLRDCPKTKELYLFRKKFIGHRSIDSIKAEDLLQEQIYQAGCFMRRSFGGKLDSDFDPKKNMLDDMDLFLTPKRYLSEKAFIRYVIFSNGAHATFIPQKDHPIIIEEIQNLYTKLFNSR